MSSTHNPIPVKHLRSPRLVRGSDAEFEKAWREDFRSIGPESGVDFYNFRKEFAEWRRNINPFPKWEIQAAFDKRRGIHNLPGQRPRV